MLPLHGSACIHFLDIHFYAVTYRDTLTFTPMIICWIGKKFTKDILLCHAFWLKDTKGMYKPKTWKPAKEIDYHKPSIISAKALPFAQGRFVKTGLDLLRKGRTVRDLLKLADIGSARNAFGRHLWKKHPCSIREKKRINTCIELKVKKESKSISIFQSTKLETY